MQQFSENHFGDTQKAMDVVSTPIIGGTGRVEGAWGNQTTLNTMYENLETVYRCVSFIATNLSRVVWKIYDNAVNGDKIDVTVDPKYDLLIRKPNPFQTIVDFREEIFSRLLMQGELFWHFSSNANNVPDQIYGDWDSSKVNIITHPKTKIGMFELNRNGKVWPIPPEEVFMIKYFNPNDTVRGLSPLRAARHSIELDLNAIGFNKSFFKQGMKMSGVLQTQQSIKEEDAKNFKRRFEQLYGGTDKMHQVAVLWNGMKFDPIQNMSMSDAQFMELREANSLNIIMTYGLSPEVLGIGKATFQNVRYYRRMAWTETIQPLMNKIIQNINTFFLPLLTKNNPRITLEADYTNIEALKEDRAQKSKDYLIGIKTGSVTRNEMRVDVFGKEKYKDPEMDIPIPVKISGAGSDGGTNQPLDKILYVKGLYYRISNSDKEVQAKMLAKIWQAEIKALVPSESKFKENIIGYFKEQRDRILSNVDSYVVRKSAKINLTSENILFDFSSEESILFKEATPWIFEVFEKAAKQLMADLKAGLIDMEVPSVRQAMGERVLKFSNFLNAETDKKIKLLVKEIFQENIGSQLSNLRDKLKEAISKLYEDFTTSRADLIARTEVVGSRNMGIQEAMVQGKVLRKMWITSRDNRVRDTHVVLDGEVVNVGQSFSNGMLYPNDYNERCLQIATNEQNGRGSLAG